MGRGRTSHGQPPVRVASTWMGPDESGRGPLETQSAGQGRRAFGAGPADTVLTRGNRGLAVVADGRLQEVF
jgi:hypothetical protein